MSVKRILSRMGLVLAGALVVIYVGLYLFQDLIIFQSVKLGKEHTYQFDVDFKEYFIPVPNADGAPDTLNALWFRPDSASRGLILYFHGNRGNLQRWGQYASKLTRLGYEVLVFDYRGYGKSTGQPGEQSLYDDAKIIFRWAIHKGARPAIIYGRSLGTAVASNLAIDTKPDVLILETPFDEIRGAIPPYWKPLSALLPLKYTFSNAEHLRLVHSRIVIFHGTNDRIVPLSSAMQLKEWTAPSDFVIIEGGTHRNLSSFPVYTEKLESLLIHESF